MLLNYVFSVNVVEPYAVSLLQLSNRILIASSASDPGLCDVQQVTFCLPCLGEAGKDQSSAASATCATAS